MTQTYIYLCTNPAWPNWTKVGVTSNIKKRLNMYQTSSPFNDFVFETIIKTKDSALLEDCISLHYMILNKNPSEWINQPHDVINNVLNDYILKLKENRKLWEDIISKQKSLIKGDTMKYIKRGKSSPSLKWLIQVSNIDILEKHLKRHLSNLDASSLDTNKLYTSSELANLFGMYLPNGKPYSAIVLSWARHKHGYGLKLIKQ